MSGRPMTCSTRVAEPTGTVDLLTTMAPVLQVGTDLLGRRLHVGQVGRPVVALGGRHAQEDELGAEHGLGGRGGEAQVAGVDALGHQLVQPLLDDGHHPAAQGGQALRVALGQHHPMAEVGQGGRSGQADVAGADHRHRGRCRVVGPLVPALVTCVRHAGTSSVARASHQPRQPVVPVRQGRQAAQAQGHVVEHRVGRAGGRAGRVELGGGDGLYPLGILARRLQGGPDEAPPGGGPAVGHVEDAPAPVGAQRHDGRGQVGREGRRAPLVVDEAQDRLALGQPQGGLDHVGPVGPADPRRAHDGRPGRALPFAGQLARAVDREGVGGVPLPVGPRRRSRRRRSRWRRRAGGRRRPRRPRPRCGSRWR